MRQITNRCLPLIGFAALAAVSLFAAPVPTPEAAPELTLTVRIYALVPEAAPRLGRAIEEADRVFKKAGITVRWLACPAGEERDAECDGAPGRGDIRLRILGGRADGDLNDALGYAMPLEHSQGVYASVLFGAVEQVRRGTVVSTAQVLGHVMAHEVGHLLLGDISHARDGLMAAKWDHHDFLRIGRRDMRFSDRETRRLRDDVRARMVCERDADAVSLAAVRTPRASGMAE